MIDIKKLQAIIDNKPDNATHHDLASNSYWDGLNHALWNHNGFWFEWDLADDCSSFRSLKDIQIILDLSAQIEKMA